MNLFWAIIFIGGGFLIRFQINKRQFNRRNAAGVEEFNSYGSAYTTHMLEKVGRIVGVFFIIIGILWHYRFSLGQTNNYISYFM
jgi:hypothetical protein